jgi:hypothetical protein
MRDSRRWDVDTARSKPSAVCVTLNPKPRNQVPEGGILDEGGVPAGLAPGEIADARKEEADRVREEEGKVKEEEEVEAEAAAKVEEIMDTMHKVRRGPGFRTSRCCCAYSLILGICVGSSA